MHTHTHTHGAAASSTQASRRCPNLSRVAAAAAAGCVGRQLYPERSDKLPLAPGNPASYCSICTSSSSSQHASYAPSSASVPPSCMLIANGSVAVCMSKLQLFLLLSLLAIFKLLAAKSQPQNVSRSSADRKNP